MAGSKRTRADAGADEIEEAELALVAQKAKVAGGGSNDASTAIAISTKGTTSSRLRGVKRTSSLDAPIMLLEGHADGVNGVKFSPDGTVLASCGADKVVNLWKVSGDCENYMMMRGHKNTVLELHWTADGDNLVTCSPDKSVRCWDAHVGVSVKNMRGHQAFVNSCAPSTRGDPLVISGSDDGTAKLWDLRRKHAVRTFPHRFQVTAVAFSKDASQVYTGGVDNVLRAYDVRKEDAPYLTLPGHTDTITGIATSPDGTHVLTNAMDCTLRMWDVQPYASGDRCVKYFTGHSHNFEKTLLRCSWSADGTRVSAGSSCANVFVWDVDSRRVLYKLPGHGGTVGEVAFHPKEPVIASGSADHKIYLGELAD